MLIFRIFALVTAAIAWTGACVAPQNGRTARLEVTNWKLVGMDGLPVATPSERPFVLSFGHDGRVSGQACNHLGGSYHVEQQQLVVGQIVMTDMSCGELLDRLESRFLQILATPVAYHFAQDGSLLLGDPNRPVARLLPTTP